MFKKHLDFRNYIISKTIFPFMFLLACSLPASNQVSAPPQKHPIALMGGDIYTVSGGIMKGGTVLFEGGTITAVGINISLPDSTERINIVGKRIYPVFIDSNTKLGLVEINAVRATLDFDEREEIRPNVRAEVAINPDSELLPVARTNGIGMALSVPEGGFISGSSALIMLDGWTWEQMTLKAPVGVHIQWPEMEISVPLDSVKKAKEEIKKRDDKILKIRQAFINARAYMFAKEAEKQQGIPFHDTDVRWDALIPVLKNEIPVFIHATEIRQIQSAIDWALAENLKIVLVGGFDAWYMADVLKEHQIPVIIGGIHRLPVQRGEGYDTPFLLALKLFEKGIEYCIASSGSAFDAANSRNLPYQAATAAAYGLPKEEALKSITLYPAKILGVSNRVGSIEIGKDASLMVTDGDPLEITTNVEMEFIQGRKIDLSNRHTQLYNKYKEKYRQLGILKD